jgi:hypothetical protein
MVGNNDWSAYTKGHLEQQFPNLANEGYIITSPDTIDFQKIAIYADAQNVPRHVARQVPNGEWTSKIG